MSRLFDRCMDEAIEVARALWPLRSVPKRSRLNYYVYVSDVTRGGSFRLVFKHVFDPRLEFEVELDEGDFLLGNPAETVANLQRKIEAARPYDWLEAASRLGLMARLMPWAWEVETWPG